MQGAGPLLSIHPRPLQGESATSWIARVAAANNVRVWSMLSSYVGRDKWHERDIDWMSNAEATKLYGMAGSRHHPESINNLFLSRWTRSLGTTKGKGARYSYSWITLPTQTRYCPLCLQMDVDRPYLRLAWRILFAPICPKHKIFLRTGCQNPHCRYSQPMRLLSTDFSCANCGTRFSDTQQIKPPKFPSICKFISNPLMVLNSEHPPRSFAFLKTTSNFLGTLLYIVRWLGIDVARKKTPEPFSKRRKKSSHDRTLLDFWRSDEIITFVLIYFALQVLQEQTKETIIDLNKKRYSVARRQAPPPWIRDKASGAGEMIERFTDIQ